MDPLCFTPWYTSALAQGLKQEGARVRLICSPFLQEPDYFARMGLKPNEGLLSFSRFAGSCPKLSQRVLRISETVLNMRSLTRELHQGSAERPAILHLQQLPLLNRGFRCDFKLIEGVSDLGIPVVYTVHNLLPHDTGSRLRSTYAELYRRVDHLICHSQHTRQELIEHFGIAEDRINVIPHGPLFERRHPCTAADQIASRSRLSLPADRPIVLWQGILAPYKGLETLLAAWKTCSSSWAQTSGPRPLLLIAGSGSPKLERQVRESAELLRESVRADLGYIPSQRLPDYFLAADLLVYPYSSITTSGALLTGLSYGKPIVASRLTPFEDYLEDGVNAVLVDPGDTTSLATTLHALLNSVINDAGEGHAAASFGTWAGLCLRAAENSARYVGWREIARQSIALYSNLASARLAHHSA